MHWPRSGRRPPLLLTGCGERFRPTAAPATQAAAPQTLTVLAAASLTETFTALGKQFETDHPGVTVKFNFAGSSDLAQQIVNGAPGRRLRRRQRRHDEDRHRREPHRRRSR